MVICAALHADYTEFYAFRDPMVTLRLHLIAGTNKCEFCECMPNRII